MSGVQLPDTLRCCAHCSRSSEDGAKLMKCTGCADAPVYCSKACQKAHWPTHKVFCKAGASNKRTLENPRWATPELLHGFASAEELTQTFNDYSRAHRWALQTSLSIHTLLRYDFGRLPQPDNVVLRFCFARRTTSKPTRDPACAFTFTRMSWYETRDPAEVREFATMRSSSLAVSGNLLNRDGRPADSIVLMLFALEGGVHSVLECYSSFHPRRFQGVPRATLDGLKAPLEDLARMCVASLNTAFPIHTLPAEGCPRLPVPGRYVRENKNWVWKPLFTDWEDYLAGRTDCGPLDALEGLTSGLPPHHLIMLFFSI